MIARLLLDPAAETAGAAPAAPVATSGVPATTPEKPPVPAAKVDGDMVSLPRDEFVRLYGVSRELEALKTEQQKALEAKDREKLKAIGEKEGIERALGTQKDDYESKLTAKEGEILGFHRDAALSKFLLGRDWHSEVAAQQAAAILASRYHAVRQSDGRVAVLDRATGVPAESTIKGLLDGPEFAHFQKAATTGGARQGSTAHTAPAPVGDPLGDLMAQVRRSTANQHGGAIGLSAVNRIAAALPN